MFKMFCNHKGYSMLVQDWSGDSLEAYWECSNCGKVTYGIGNRWVHKDGLPRLRKEVERNKEWERKKRHSEHY